MNQSTGRPGDHVICVFPTYQQLYSIPESLRTEVTLWKLQENDAWIPDVALLKGLIRKNTRRYTYYPTPITPPSSA